MKYNIDQSMIDVLIDHYKKDKSAYEEIHRDYSVWKESRDYPISCKLFASIHTAEAWMKAIGIDYENL